MNNRIKLIEDQINRNKFAQENNVRTLEKVSANLIEFVETSGEITKAHINKLFPELLDKNYIESLKEMSYDNLMSVKDRLLILENSLLDSAEESLS